LQRYSIYYLFAVFNDDKTLKYCPKISIEHFIQKEGVERQRPSSLRFSNQVFLEEFIMELVRSLAFFEKSLHKELNPFSKGGNLFYKNKIINLLEKVNDNYRSILREER